MVFLYVYGQCPSKRSCPALQGMAWLGSLYLASTSLAEACREPAVSLIR